MSTHHAREHIDLRIHLTHSEARLIDAQGVGARPIDLQQIRTIVGVTGEEGDEGVGVEGDVWGVQHILQIDLGVGDVGVVAKHLLPELDVVSLRLTGSADLLLLHHARLIGRHLAASVVAAAVRLIVVLIAVTDAKEQEALFEDLHVLDHALDVIAQILAHIDAVVAALEASLILIVHIDVDLASRAGTDVPAREYHVDQLTKHLMLVTLHLAVRDLHHHVVGAPRVVKLVQVGSALQGAQHLRANGGHIVLALALILHALQILASHGGYATIVGGAGALGVERLIHALDRIDDALGDLEVDVVGATRVGVHEGQRRLHHSHLLCLVGGGIHDLPRGGGDVL